ncbi:hypothetical protein C1H87_03780 [Flavivirga eckloniae]|uniref:Uncharacterized protein n=1 Tax=Flavivirga eckloniae TaxID=1803846 RepID=A0A2K9PM09_9FLAO|nr:hypothetical protein C1H87_03780 [Flavivirga eckloniae]
MSGEFAKNDRLKNPSLYVKKYCLDRLNQLLILSNTTIHDFWDWLKIENNTFIIDLNSYYFKFQKQ